MASAGPQLMFRALLQGPGDSALGDPCHQTRSAVPSGQPLLLKRHEVTAFASA